MIVLHLNNWDSPDIFRLSTDFNFFDAIQGILLSPFAHSTDSHLINNVVPLFFMMSLIIYVFGNYSYMLFFLFYFLTGLFIWRFASIIDPSTPYHSVIGASGVLYAMVSFLFFSGLIRRNRELLGYSLLIVFLYGSMVWGMFPFSVKDNVSWEAHLMGFIVGLLLSFLFRKIGPQKKVYEWEDEEDEEDEDDEDDEVLIKYHYKK